MHLRDRSALALGGHSAPSFCSQQKLDDDYDFGDELEDDEDDDDDDDEDDEDDEDEDDLDEAYEADFEDEVVFVEDQDDEV